MKAYRIDLNQVVKDFDGDEILIPRKDAKQPTDLEPAYLRRVLAMALAIPATSRRNAEALLDDMELGRRVRVGGWQEFNESEVKIMREQIVYRFMEAAQVPQGELASGALEMLNAGKQGGSAIAPAGTGG